jgi:hypothetical protein
VLGQPVTVASVLPGGDHPALRVEPAVEQGASDEGNDKPAAPAPERHATVSHARTHTRIKAKAASAPSSHHREREKKSGKKETTKRPSHSSHSESAKSPKSKKSSSSSHRHHH